LPNITAMQVFESTVSVAVVTGHVREYKIVSVLS